MVFFFAEISSLDFPKNVVYTKYLKLLTFLIDYLPAILSQCLSLIKHTVYEIYTIFKAPFSYYS